MDKLCDNCSSQEGRHYCLLHSKIVKNMDISSCDDFTEKEEFENHSTGKAVCMVCKHEWTAVVPTGVIDLECPSCHLMKGHFLYPCLREDYLHWECGCGNQLFRVTKDGYYCPNCGEWQQGF